MDNKVVVTHSQKILRGRGGREMWDNGVTDANFVKWRQLFYNYLFNIHK